MVWCGGYIHDKSDGAMGKHLVRCQLSRPFFPACGLEIKIKIRHHPKEATQMSALEFRLGGKNARTFCNALSMFVLGTPPARAFLMTLKSAMFFSGSTEPPSEVAHMTISPQARAEGEGKLTTRG